MIMLFTPLHTYEFPTKDVYLFHIVSEELRNKSRFKTSLRAKEKE